MSSYERIAGSHDVGEPPLGFPEWETFTVRINPYRRYTDSYSIEEEVVFFRRTWRFLFYPMTRTVQERQVKVELYKRSRDEDVFEPEVDMEGEIKIRDSDGGVAKKVAFTKRAEDASEIQTRLPLTTAAILDPSSNILRDGTLTIEVSMRKKLPPTDKSQRASFVPPNPISQSICKMFLDEETADVLFRIGSQDLHAHRIILQACAPDLAELCVDYEELTPVPITNVEPHIFRHLLHYVYGGEISFKDLQEHAAEIIDASDRYGVPNLKLLAEAHYLKANEITLENVVDQLHYAEAMNLALLFEKVVEFFVDNDEVLQRTLLKMDPESEIRASLLAAVAAKNNQSGRINPSDIKAMDVSCLRRQLHEKGLCVDGSRETLIAALEKDSAEGKGAKRKRGEEASTAICV